MNSQDEDKIKYEALDFSNFLAKEILEKGINPENQLKGIEIQFNDNNKSRKIVKDIAFEEFKGIKHMYDIHGMIERMLAILSKTDIYDNVDISFLPGSQEDKIKLVVDVKEKSRYSGHVGQEFDRDGSVLVNSSFAYRNLLGLFDKFTFESHKSLYASNKQGYSFSYSFPIIHRLMSLDLGYSLQTRSITPSIHEEAEGGNIKLWNSTKDTYVTLESRLRTNKLNIMDCSKYILDNELLPNQKRSIRIGKLFRDTRANIIKDYGDYLEGSVEFAFPLSDAKFVKLDFNYNRYFNPEFLDKIKKLKYINFENCFHFGFVRPFGSSINHVNDRFIAMNSRGFNQMGNRPYPFEKNIHPHAGEQGFEFLADYVGEDVIAENTFKMNFYSYPFLGKYKIVPFLYTSLYYLPGDLFRRNTVQNPTASFNLAQSLKDNVRGVCGMGLGVSLGQVKLELLLNHFHLAKTVDKKARFQLRLSVND